MYEYQATVVDVIDGDTVRLDVDLGFSIRQRMALRLYGINAPEMVGATKAAGVLARLFLMAMFPLDGRVTIRTFKDKTDKYGRILADIFTQNDLVPVSKRMVDAGHAVAYHGGKR
jgi:micrococcal nuclease